MKQLLKYTIPALFVGFVLSIAAHAQVVNPPLFRKVGSNIYPLGNVSSTIIGTSTATGQFQTLTDGSGNKYSTSTGSGSSNVSTSSANTWSAAQTFNATSTFGGDITLGSSSVVYASPLGYTLTGDFGTYVNNLCAAGVASFGAADVHLPGMSVASSSFIVGINLATQNGRCHLEGIGGNGTSIHWGGSGAMITLNNSKINNANNSIAVEGIHFVNDGSAATSSGIIGILWGGSTNGGAHQFVQYNTFQNFGYCIVFASNTYDAYLEHNSLTGCGQTIDIQTANNATEGTHIAFNWIGDPSNGNPNDCIVAESSGGDDIELDNNVIDDCQIHQKNGTVIHISDNKTEHPSTAYPPYIPFLQDSSGFSFMQITGEKVFVLGNATQTFTALFDLNASALINGVSIDGNATSGSAMANLLQDSSASANENVTICGVTLDSTSNRQQYVEFAPKSLNVPITTFNGCVSQVGDSTTTYQGSQSDGSYSFQTSQFTVDNVPIGALFSGTNFVNLANSAASSTLIGTVNGTTTIPANTLKAGSTLKFSASGLWQTSASGTNTSYFISLGTNFVQSNVVGETGVGAGRGWKLDCSISVWSGGSSGVWDPGCFFTGGVSAGGIQAIYIAGTTSTVNTTIANTFDFKWLYATASSTNSVTSTAIMLSVSP